MTHVTETEILSCLKTHFRSSAADCEALAVLPARGPTYKRMRESLKLIEGCCRQIAWYRQDTRWLGMGMQVEEAHQRAGHWLRRHYPRPLFVKLAEVLRGGAVACEALETKATGRVGMILPKPQKADRTAGRPMQVLMPGETHSTGGLIVPASMH